MSSLGKYWTSLLFLLVSLYSCVVAADGALNYRNIYNPFASKSSNEEVKACSLPNSNQVLFKDISIGDLIFQGKIQSKKNTFAIMRSEKNSAANGTVLVELGSIVALGRFILIAVNSKDLVFKGPFDKKSCSFSKNIVYISR